jgi:hypothetical protein
MLHAIPLGAKPGSADAYAGRVNRQHTHRDDADIGHRKHTERLH